MDGAALITVPDQITSEIASHKTNIKHDGGVINEVQPIKLYSRTPSYES